MFANPVIKAEFPRPAKHQRQEHYQIDKRQLVVAKAIIREPEKNRVASPIKATVKINAEDSAGPVQSGLPALVRLFPHKCVAHH